MKATNPEYWFLPAAVTAGRGYTSGNEVRALIDGQAYMAHLHERLEGMRDQDLLHLIGWRTSPGQPLRPDLPGSPTLDEHVRRVLSRGARVRSLLWRFPVSLPLGGYGHARDNHAFTHAVLQSGGEAMLDARTHPDALSCHHQKAVVLSSGGHAWAYVGGMDLCVDRWDTPTHDGAPGREPVYHAAWHDVHSVLRGPAVRDVQRNFAERWNELAWRFPAGPCSAVDTLTGGSDARFAEYGAQHVQVLRTLPPGVHSFAPAGEQSLRVAYERAVERAEHYVYIEDQHFWLCGLVERLRDAAARGVQVILTLAREYRVPGLTPYHNALRAEALAVLRSRAPHNVHVFHLRQADRRTDVNVHAKVLIVDDRYAAVGSANIGRRSFTTDSELALAVVDGETRAGRMAGRPVTVTRFAHELRTALWGEHLGVTPAEVEDPLLALELWPGQDPGHQVHHAVTHRVPRPRWRFPGVVGRCMNPRPDGSGEVAAARAAPSEST